MVEPTSAQRMLLTNRVQTNTVAWPQGGRQVLVPSWSQQAAPHSLIVDSAPFLNMEEIYPKHHLNLPRHELKKESPVHHLPYVYYHKLCSISFRSFGDNFVILFCYYYYAVCRATTKKKRISCRRLRNVSKRIHHHISNDTIGLMYRHNTIRARIILTITQIRPIRTTQTT